MKAMPTWRRSPGPSCLTSTWWPAMTATRSTASQTAKNPGKQERNVRSEKPGSQLTNTSSLAIVRGQSVPKLILSADNQNDTIPIVTGQCQRLACQVTINERG